MDDLIPLINLHAITWTIEDFFFDKMKFPGLWGSFEVFISKIVDGLLMEKVTEKKYF